MLKKMTLAAAKGFEKHSRAARKAEFLARMERLMPWAEFCALIEPHYPKAGNGRPPVGLERMLRLYCIANWFNFSGVACEDALYDGPVFREFCRIDLGRERMPDATTLMNFRHLLEVNHLGAALFAKVSELLLANGTKLSGGTIGDTTLIAAPPSTKNKTRDPEMHQTKNGNEWHFGMKLHIGADSKTGLVHSASVTPPTSMTFAKCRVCSIVAKAVSTAIAPTGERINGNGSENRRRRRKTYQQTRL